MKWNRCNPLNYLWWCKVDPYTLHSISVIADVVLSGCWIPDSWNKNSHFKAAHVFPANCILTQTYACLQVNICILACRHLPSYSHTNIHTHPCHLLLLLIFGLVITVKTQEVMFLPWSFRHWALVTRDHSNAGSNAVTVLVKLKIIKYPSVLWEGLYPRSSTLISVLIFQFKFKLRATGLKLLPIF